MSGSPVPHAPVRIEGPVLSKPILPDRRIGRPGKTWVEHAQGAVLPIILVSLWEIASRIDWLPRALIAPPSAVAIAFKDLLRNGELFGHIVVSAGRLASGFTIGCAAGFLLGIVVGVSRLWERYMMPTMLVLAPIPIIAWVPLFIVLFGIDGARLGLVSFGSFFIVFFGAVTGIRSVDDELVEMAHMYGKSKSETLLHVLLPASLPSVLQSLRTASAMSWVLLIMAEIIASSRGLGWLLWDSRNFGRSDDMIVAMLTIGLLGKLVDSLLVSLSEKALWWRQSFKGE